MGLFKRWFKKDYKNIEVPIKQEITLGTLKEYDDIQVKIGNDTYDGWVYAKSGQNIYVVYTNKDNKLEYAEFIIERPLNRKEITVNNITFIIL